MAVGKAFTEMPNLPARPSAIQQTQGAVKKSHPTPTPTP